VIQVIWFNFISCSHNSALFQLSSLRTPTEWCSFKHYFLLLTRSYSCSYLVRLEFITHSVSVSSNTNQTLILGYSVTVQPTTVLSTVTKYLHTHSQSEPGPYAEFHIQPNTDGIMTTCCCIPKLCHFSFLSPPELMSVQSSPTPLMSLWKIFVGLKRIPNQQAFCVSLQSEDSY